MSLVFCGENQCYFGNSAAWTWMVAVWCHSDVGVSHLPQLEVYLREHVAQESADLRRQSWAECGSDRCESEKMKQVLFSLHWGPVRHAPLDQIRHCSFVSRTQSCLVLLTRRFGISRECSPLQASSSLVEATWLEVQSKGLLCPTSFSGFALIGLLRNNLSMGQSCIPL